MVTLADLPIELFIDHIFPILPVSDLLSLARTNHFFSQLASDEPFWHRKVQEDFNFPTSDTARNAGWKFLYRKLSIPKVLVWGERSNGRLGLGDGNFPNTAMNEGVPYPIRLRIPGVRIVHLEAGGMSFHALDSQGNIHVWGTLDGTSAALRSEGYSIPSQKAEQPMRLNLPVKFRSISCGRLHCTALDATSHVWTFTSWGRPFKIMSSSLDKSSPETTPVQVESGWGFSSVLMQSGDVLVYWPFEGRMKAAIAAKNVELDQQSAATQTKALPTVEEPRVIPCYPWNLQNVHPVRLPPIPDQALPRLTGTGLSHEELDDETKLIKIASMDNIIVGLTNKGHVLMYVRLTGESAYRRGGWRYLPEFSELKNVREHPTFTKRDTHLEAPDTMRITHISAHFNTFVAYSTGARSVVLIGKPNTLLTPQILPALQNREVISVVLGDYHYGALTASGTLLTWGAFSKGALGLGEPSHVPFGQPGGFVDEAQLEAAGMRWGNPRFPPPAVEVPTEVRFDHRESRQFCFAVTAGGWHMGALVIGLEPDAE
ncbi:hypothetical protein POSPLADRAFT_1165938 [Postia placenta MAD-698-R-SB12]|uniref:F-box domain-containing protein n=1 Tax=Postia placenta MAD-698-R-SB12 TaxID=670580 RepID=A0A1X6NBR1_9APHY|nr:hypothetical protein POSPLADRAFT_1165938 [Postia placenta MAD-698-R-SB12]OSX65942.1 hypothetical protein POSPLADRAFT_1165938 [Postia placenta MAD-698-R-SB12]